MRSRMRRRTRRSSTNRTSDRRTRRHTERGPRRTSPRTRLEAAAESRSGDVNARLNRLFAADGRCFDVAVDHGFFGEASFLAGIEDMGRAIETLVEARPDAIQLSPGQAPLLQRIRGPKPALVSASGSKTSRLTRSSQVAPVFFSAIAAAMV